MGPTSLVDAGAYSNGDWDSKDANPGRYRQNLRVFQVTQPLIRSVLLVRTGMRPELKAEILRALEEFGSAADAAPVRKRYYHVSRFAPVSSDLTDAIADSREVYRTVRGLFE